jgi:hypothetical protein
MKRGSRWPTCKKRRSDKKLLLILIRRRKLETKTIHLARGMGTGIHTIMSAPRRGSVAVLQCSFQIRWRDTPFGQGLTSREPGGVLRQLGEAYKRRIQQDVQVATPRLTDLGQDLGFPDPQLLPSVRTPVFAPGVELVRIPRSCVALSNMSRLVEARDKTSCWAVRLEDRPSSGGTRRSWSAPDALRSTLATVLYSAQSSYHYSAPREETLSIVTLSTLQPSSLYRTYL